MDAEEAGSDSDPGDPSSVVPSHVAAGLFSTGFALAGGYEQVLATANIDFAFAADFDEFDSRFEGWVYGFIGVALPYNVDLMAEYGFNFDDVQIFTGGVTVASLTSRRLGGLGPGEGRNRCATCVGWPPNESPETGPGARRIAIIHPLGIRIEGRSARRRLRFDLRPGSRAWSIRAVPGLP